MAIEIQANSIESKDGEWSLSKHQHCSQEPRCGLPSNDDLGNSDGRQNALSFHNWIVWSSDQCSGTDSNAEFLLAIPTLDSFDSACSGDSYTIGITANVAALHIH